MLQAVEQYFSSESDEITLKTFQNSSPLKFLKSNFFDFSVTIFSAAHWHGGNKSVVFFRSEAFQPTFKLGQPVYLFFFLLPIPLQSSFASASILCVLLPFRLVLKIFISLNNVEWK
jgi:hypothetical protein